MERIHHPEVLPLEVGDLWVDGRLLGGLNEFEDFLRTLRRAIETLHAGQGATHSNGPLAPVVAGFEAVFITGGHAANKSVHASLAGMHCPVIFDAAGIFGAAFGGLQWLQERQLSGWVVDLGKSHLKIISTEQQWAFPCDRERLAGKAVSAQEMPRHRRRLREFIAVKLQLAMAESQARPKALLFALPTRVDAAGTPEGFEYAGMSGDRTFLPDSLELAGLGGLPLYVLNDAELAGLSARLNPQLAGFRKVLVVTLGSGIGAALILRGDGTSE
jgi:hypothetical protein